jgi:plastocyanin
MTVLVIESSHMNGRSRHSELSIVSVIQMALLALVMAFAFATPFISTARAATTWDVSIVDFAFQPASVTIQPGDTVRWTNTVTTQHSVVNDVSSTEVFSSSPLSQNGVFTHTFNSIGDFGYHCGIHTFMTATVHVSVTGIPEFSSLPIVMLGLLVVVLGLTAAVKRR